MHGEGTDTQGDVARGKPVPFQDGVDFLGSLDCNRIPVEGLNVPVKDLIALGVSSTSKSLPEFKYGLRNHLHAVARITPHKEATVMGQNLVLQRREDVLHDVPIVIAIAHAAERSVRVEFGEESLEEDALAVRVNVRVFVVRVVPGVLRAVGTHDEVLGRYGTEGNLLVLTITVVVLLKVRNDRDGGAVHKGKTPGRCGLQSGIKALVTPEVKVTEGATTGNIVLAGLVVPLVHNLAVGVSNGSADHRIPHFGGDKAFKGLSEPREVRVRVGNAEDRAVNRDLGTLRKREHFNREITQAVQVPHLVIVTEIRPQGLVHNPGILLYDLVLTLVEEVLVEEVNQPGLTESLETEVHHMVPTIDA